MSKLLRFVRSFSCYSIWSTHQTDLFGIRDLDFSAVATPCFFFRVGKQQVESSSAEKSEKEKGEKEGEKGEKPEQGELGKPKRDSPRRTLRVFSMWDGTEDSYKVGKINPKLKNKMQSTNHRDNTITSMKTSLHRRNSNHSPLNRFESDFWPEFVVFSGDSNTGDPSRPSKAAPLCFLELPSSYLPLFLFLSLSFFSFS
ncbi:PREDICTED: uncharacterized protein LOC104807525 isoform X2 [Tarenaya hassleriana]|uniref:uncharacterized protein LOC104807525 isoform X2 n=1 Tax=Tarenaya hassleriana TaxID=28532 RepID=UPI00053C50DC|nr:PREDICTED: uncharacterized protein LOC104807525 isoform X2 [Tarenaya hassleriana]